MWLSANRENVDAFLLALLLASTTWLIHNLSLKYNETLTVKLAAYSNIEGHMERAVSTVDVSAVCRATGYRFINFAFGKGLHEVKLHIDPEDLRSLDGDVYYISSERLKDYSKDLFGSEVTVDRFLLDSLYLRFNKENYKKVPVRVMQRLSFTPQYMSRDGIKIEPDSILVYGEASRLDGVDEVCTEIISLKKLASDASGKVALEKLPGLRFSDKSVNWSIKTNRYVEISEKAVISVKNVPVGKSLFVYPSVVDVKIRYIFPPLPDAGNVEFYVDYVDFLSSVNGQCIIKTLPLPEGVLGYELSRDIVECVTK